MLKHFYLLFMFGISYAAESPQVRGMLLLHVRNAAEMEQLLAGIEEARIERHAGSIQVLLPQHRQAHILLRIEQLLRSIEQIHQSQRVFYFDEQRDNNLPHDDNDAFQDDRNDFPFFGNNFNIFEENVDHKKCVKHVIYRQCVREQKLQKRDVNNKKENRRMYQPRQRGGSFR